MEGQTERQFIQYIAARTGRDPLRHGVTIVEANGLGLMPGLIRIARQVLEHWRAVCDSDLLTRPDKDKNFVGFRSDLGKTLELDISHSTGQAFEDTRKALRDKGVFVTSKSGLEYYYQSPEVEEHIAKTGKAEHADKGWLMAQEIEFLRSKPREFIEEKYSEFLQPLDALLNEVKAAGFKPRPMYERIQDTLKDHGEEIHRKVFREKWTEQQLKDYIRHSRGISRYQLDFRTFEDYELQWKDSLGDSYRILFKQEHYDVYQEAPNGKYTKLCDGTVGKLESK